MRILERNSNQVFDTIEIFLTSDEAKELIGKLEGLIINPKSQHIHLDTDEAAGYMQKELTIAIYSQDNSNDFDERSRTLIDKDE